MALSSDRLKIDPVAVEKEIVHFIKDYVSKSRTKGAVLAMSGGLDSSVTAVLCSKALGGKRVTGIVFRDGILRRGDELDAEGIAKKFGIKLVTCDITRAMDVMLDHMSTYIRGDRLTRGNLKVRLCMAIAYYHANHLNLLVVGTTNKSELMTGYFTKYGDAAVDIMPIADLYKTQVIQLAQHLGIPKRIITKQPSAGLWEGQLDEEELGIKYEELDPILYGYEHGMSASEIAETLKVNKSLVKHVLGLIEKSDHKRRLPPTPRLKV